MSAKPARGLGRGLGSLIGGGPVPAQTSPGTGPDNGSAAAAPPGPGGAGGGAGSSGAAPAAATDATTGTPAPGTPEGLVEVPGATFLEIPVDLISPNPKQPRTVFEEEPLAELVHSIKEIGLLQPVVVRRVGDRFELIAGERRLRATQAAGLTSIPAIVRDTADDDLLRDALLENLHRAQLNPLEEAAAYQQLLDDFGCTQEELATRIGRSRPQVSNTLRLLRLPPTVARRVAAGVLTAGHAKVLLSLDDDATIEALAARVVAEGISVRGLEEVIALGVGTPGTDDESADGRPARRRAPKAPGLASIAERLSDRLDTRVRVEMGRSKGRITIEFATLDDLQRVLSVIESD